MFGAASQSTHALLCLGNWNVVGYIKDPDVKIIARMPDFEGKEGKSSSKVGSRWDSILLKLSKPLSCVPLFCHGNSPTSDALAYAHSAMVVAQPTFAPDGNANPFPSNYSSSCLDFIIYLNYPLRTRHPCVPVVDQSAVRVRR